MGGVSAVGATGGIILLGPGAACPTFMGWLGLGGATAAGTGSTLTTVSTTAGTVHISTTGTVATIEVGFIQRLSSTLIKEIISVARSQGAKSAIVNTGPIVNADLAIKFGLAAKNGTTIFGGIVRLVEGGAAPVFEIIIPLL